MLSAHLLLEICSLSFASLQPLGFLYVMIYLFLGTLSFHNLNLCERITCLPINICLSAYNPRKYERILSLIVSVSKFLGLTTFSGPMLSSQSCLWVWFLYWSLPKLLLSTVLSWESSFHPVQANLVPNKSYKLIVSSTSIFLLYGFNFEFEIVWSESSLLFFSLFK